MMKPQRMPKPALDWGLNNNLYGILQTLLIVISQLLTPLSSLVQTIIGLFTGTGTSTGS